MPIQTSKNEEAKLVLTVGQKIIGVILAIIVPLLTTGAGYLAFRAITDYRLSANEKIVDNHELRISQIEKQDLDRRTTKIETRLDEQADRINHLTSQVDVAVSILQRLEKIEDEKDKASKNQ